ncbi:MAG: (2Fe-2S)-binding protein [Deltaproteobacteria bacterium]|nr:(2Fe-2S)-binding protein [Deltaproteobacteria bacterium]
MSKPRRFTEDELRARLRVVCICKGIKLAKISDAIGAGARTVAEVNRATGSGDGGCGATRCTPVILEMLRHGGRPPAKLPALAAAEHDEDYWFPPLARKTEHK